VFKATTGTTANSYGVQRLHKANDYLKIKNTEKNDKDKAEEKANSDSYQTQEIFEKVLKWITGSGLKPGTDDDVLKYMEIRRNAAKYPDASELWEYFKSVMDWVWEVFENDMNANDATGDRYENEMKSVEWGLLYNNFHQKLNSLPHTDYDKAKKDIRDKIDELTNYEVSQTGKYQYALDFVLNGAKAADSSVLSLRAFKPALINKMYLKQHGICPACGCHFSDVQDMEGDHIKPWSKGGFTDEDNLQVLCADCNGKKKADEHFGQKYSRDEVIAFDQAAIDKCPEGTLNVNK
jgi:5-methylcytosine-specific restriction endonuclease McrA